MDNWIPIDKSLPSDETDFDSFTDCLVTLQNGMVTEVVFHDLNGVPIWIQPWVAQQIPINNQVIAWMHKPIPYKEIQTKQYVESSEELCDCKNPNRGVSGSGLCLCSCGNYFVPDQLNNK